VFAKVGFKNGDIVEKINGGAIDNPEKALEVYSKLRDAQKVEVQIVRAGKPVTLTYKIVN